MLEQRRRAAFEKLSGAPKAHGRSLKEPVSARRRAPDGTARSLVSGGPGGVGGWTLRDSTPEINRRTLAWLDDALRWARPGNRAGLVNLLTLVRVEILFDMAFSEEKPLVRDLAPPEIPGADGNVSEPGSGSL